MKRLPQTNFDEKLSLVYENMNIDRGGPEDDIIETLQSDGAMDIFEFDDLAREYLGYGEELNDMSQDDIVNLVGDKLGLNLEVRGDTVYLANYNEDAEDVRGESGGFSIRNELLNLYSNLDQEARTQSGASVSEELKMIIDELDDIVNKAEWDKV